MNPTRLNLGLVLGLSASLLVASASAATTKTRSHTAKQPGYGPSTPTLVTDTHAPEHQAKKLPISMSDFSMFFGPDAVHPGTPSTADDSDGARKGISARHFLSAKYAIDKNWSIQPTFDVNTQFNNDPGVTTGAGITQNDHFLRLNRNNIVNTKVNTSRVMLDADLRYYAPTSIGSANSNSYGSTRLTLTPSVEFGKSHFSFSWVNYARIYLHSRNSVTKVSAGGESSESPVLQYRLYTGPQFNYQISEKVVAYTLFEMDAKWNSYGYLFGSEKNNPKHSWMDFEPGVEIQVGKRVSLSPYLNWFTNQPLNTTSINLNANLILL